MHISDDKLAEIRNAADIVDMVSARVFLKKAGKDFVGLCPFHAEKTPSFTVSASKQIFHCFGCGVGGDIFNFLMKYDGITFPEAVQAVA
ncbi:MAG: DNA primase, partial [Desulfobacterales bacterium]|nr:DNA primase [Desulfobacterales bacterium]